MKHRQQLVAENSSLEFLLHRLQFISLLEKGADAQIEALTYARNFAPFALKHSRGKAKIRTTCGLKKQN